MSTATQDIVGREIDIYKGEQRGIEYRGKKLVARYDLECSNGNSDKTYIIVMLQDYDGFEVKAWYGRRYSYLNPATLYEGTNEIEARKAVNKQKNAKLSKGYTLYGYTDNQAEAIANKVKFDERIVWPMGAQGVKENKLKQIITSDEWIAEEKEDGVRQTIHITPNGLRFFSRNAGKDDPTRPLEKTHAFSHISGIVFPDKYIGTILDVEVMAPGLGAEDISGHINALDGRDNSFMYFKVFDLIQQGATDITSLEWRYRRMKLTALFHELKMIFNTHAIKLSTGENIDLFHNDVFNEGVFRLSTYTIKDKENFHYDIVTRGGEGTMWKNINSKYKEGAKPANAWYKWKKQDTCDVVILGFTNAKEGKYHGMIGAVVYGQFLTDEEIQAFGIKKPHVAHTFREGEDRYLVPIGQCSGMTDEQRVEFTNKQGEYINRVMEVEFMNRTKNGSLRHPRYLHLRDDKHPEDCIYSENEA